jgi:hypothetical protein
VVVTDGGVFPSNKNDAIPPIRHYSVDIS